MICITNLILKKARQNKGLTQQDMAERLGYRSKSGYNHLENGKVKLTIDIAKQLAVILKLDIKEIIN